MGRLSLANEREKGSLPIAIILIGPYRKMTNGKIMTRQK